jgi:hypothetical protein
MYDYFYLQYILTYRKLKDAGINPFLAFLLGSAAFVAISVYIFQQTEFAKYFVLLTCLGVLFNLSEKNRTEFLRITFDEKRNRRIRLVENCMVSIPFLCLLIIKNEFLEFILILTLAIFFAVFNLHTNYSFTIPTPFSKNPFEFTVGFRKTFFIFPITYSLTMIAIYVDNLNLGIFSMLLIFITSLSYYSKPEEDYYVWVHDDTPKAFLLKKIMVASKSVSLLTSPVTLSIMIFFPAEIDIIFVFFLIGLLCLWTIILGKYSAYPSQMNIPEGILMAICIYFPPSLLAIMPFFYKKSIDNLNLILNDTNK